MPDLILGLDLGTNSIGWSLVRTDAKGEPCGIEAAGVRVFEAGTEGSPLDFRKGKDSSRATTRRDRRAARRMGDRRKQRMKKVFRLLQSAGLLREGPNHSPQDRDAIIRAIDADLRRKWLANAPESFQHTLPYLLRSKAVEMELDAESLGRALYHLSQRRGYRSNRAADRKTDEKETGVVKKGISDLQREMAEARCEFLGQYFSRLDPRQFRIRKRWTAREMIEKEFDRIIEVQRRGHSAMLTDDFVKQLRQAIFFQRPLKSARHLIGRCDLEPNKRRARLAFPIAQEFRLLAALNNLHIIDPAGQKLQLTPEQREQILANLRRGDVTFAAARRLLGLKGTTTHKSATDPSKKEVIPGYAFNLEDGGEKRIPGDRTAEKLVPILGTNWANLNEDQKRQFVCDLMDIQSPAAFRRIMCRRWRLNHEQIDQLADVRLEEGYAALSRCAMEKLLPLMRKGLPFATAKLRVYGSPLQTGEPMDALPPVLSQFDDLRNPAVCRALTELRKVVNALVRKYGKPSLVRIELARDLKRSRREREKNWTRSREREMERSRVKDLIRQHGGNGESRADIEKYLLAEECNWVCPYTGKAISPGNLFTNPTFDVEHIIPFSLSLDNSFSNKTLCDAEYNRNTKRRRLPTEVENPSGPRFAAIIERVSRFQGHAKDLKLMRFRMMPDEARAYYEDFTQRHLNDTRHFSKLACGYVSLLYGGQVDQQGRRVQASSGTVTALLRRAWGLDSLLSGGEVKTREDHRHHAIDATVIALTTPRTIKAFADAAERSSEIGRAHCAPTSPPWRNLPDELRACLDRMVVSHRADHRVAGPLHAETNYSRPIDAGNGSVARRVRKHISTLSRAEVAQIADPQVRDAVLKALAGGDPKNAFKGVDQAAADDPKYPHLVARDGRIIPIRRVRVRVNEKPRPIGHGCTLRHVTSGSDTLHHTAIVAVETKRGEKWEDRPSDRLEVHQRLSNREPVIVQPSPCEKLVMVLHARDCLEMDDRHGNRQYYIVRGLSKSDIGVRLHTDARSSTSISKAERPETRIRSADELRKRRACLVTVSPIGEVHRQRVV